MKIAASVKPILYTYRPLKNGEYPILIRIIKDRKAKYFTTGYSTRKEFWNAKQNKPNNKHPQALQFEIFLKNKINEINKQMLTMDNDDVNYTVDTIKKSIVNKRGNLKVFDYFKSVIAFEKEGNKIRNAEVYLQCNNRVLKFCKKQDLLFSEVDFTFLKKFENWLRTKKAKDITIHYYMRTLRALFNRAIKENLISETNYPFKLYKLGGLNCKTQKRALAETDMNKIIDLKLPLYSKLWDARNIFVFSYYTMGTNFVDMANLKWEDVQNSRISYRRAKTGELITLALLPQALEIINEYRLIRTGQYVFPILSDEHDTPLKRHYRINKLTGQINALLKEIAKECEIDFNLTTYVARHSAATILKRKGVSTSIISEMLGHGNENVTQIYLDSFENSTLDTALLLLAHRKDK